MDVWDIIIKVLAVYGGVGVIGFFGTLFWFIWEIEHAAPEEYPGQYGDD